VQWTVPLEWRTLVLWSTVGKGSSENEFSLVVNVLPGLVWTALLGWYIDFPNQRQCEYTSPSVAQACGCGRGRMKNL
jgi:hypothetical protein